MRGVYVALAVRLVVLWLVVAFLLVVLGGCSPRVAAIEPSSSVSLRFCFRLAIKAEPLPAILGVCAETWSQCEAVRALAMRHGSRAGMLAVGACKS